MKIISPFKDYYDYLAGIYGVDPKIVYERKPTNHAVYLYDGDIHWLKIMNQTYCGIVVNNKLIWDDYYLLELYNTHLTKYNHLLEYLIEKGLIKDNKGSTRQQLSTYNTANNCPIILLPRIGSKILNPNLSQLNFKGIEPKDMWLGLTEWFSPQDKIITNKPEDMNRFESKGFDKKSSFRKSK